MVSFPRRRRRAGRPDVCANTVFTPRRVARRRRSRPSSTWVVRRTRRSPVPALEVPSDLVRLSVGIETVDDPASSTSCRRWSEPAGVRRADTGSHVPKAAAVVVDGADAGRLRWRTTAVPTTVGPGLDVPTGLDDVVATGRRRGRRRSRSRCGVLRPRAAGRARGRRLRTRRKPRPWCASGARRREGRTCPAARSTATALALKAARPDVVLSSAATDGGDLRVLLHNAARLASAG